MRKLAPVFLTTSILAFAAGNAAAMGDHKAKKSTDAAPSSLSTSATNQATPSPQQGNTDSSTGAMPAGAPAAASTVPPSASPTVSSNTQNPQGMSYSDKSPGAPGTNAKMDTSPGTKGVAPSGTTTSGSSTDATTALANDDKQALSRQASGEKSTLAAADTTVKPAKKTKKKVAKVAKNENVSGNPPTEPTNGAAVGSTTGRSAGQ